MHLEFLAYPFLEETDITGVAWLRSMYLYLKVGVIEQMGKRWWSGKESVEMRSSGNSNFFGHENIYNSALVGYACGLFEMRF